MKKINYFWLDRIRKELFDLEYAIARNLTVRFLFGTAMFLPQTKKLLKIKRKQIEQYTGQKIDNQLFLMLWVGVRNSYYEIAKLKRMKDYPYIDSTAKINLTKIKYKKTETDLLALAIVRIVQAVFNKSKIHNTLFKIEKNLETKYKLNELRNMDNLFYICTAHPNPAKGHKDCENKIYYNSQKLSSVTDMRLINYIKNHNVVSVQEMIGSPIYLYTRPNCKHSFVPVSDNDILTLSTAQLIKKYQVKYKYFEMNKGVFEMLGSVSNKDKYI